MYYCEGGNNRYGGDSLLRSLYTAPHGCFSIAELLEYESLGFCPRGKAKADIDADTFSLQGELPVNADGGHKAFGHPVAARGLRMCYEIYKQIQGKANLPARQLKEVKLGLSLTQASHPGYLMPCITILGRRD